jgi:hypothetical protein
MQEIDRAIEGLQTVRAVLVAANQCIRTETAASSRDKTLPFKHSERTALAQRSIHRCAVERANVGFISSDLLSSMPFKRGECRVLKACRDVSSSGYG